ncbi:hypothetical protein M3936_09045 [Sutcliffiella horikoshii]|uniref:hypothetical protein n=1 Tax=Sutcliffiella horikoshii TaxID=79883 RepID=UPI00203BF566|nr:hypothetical protein [Sutcliffiella horikoshii]MCM3617725.1 hypothetical protein [Sutcliffiella horikoshii]
MSKKKRGISILIGIIVITSFFIFFGNRQDNNQLINTTHSFGDFYVMEKEHHIEPGDYMEMWVVGYNGAEKEENKEYYKVYFKDANVYNPIEKDQSYMFSISSISEEGKERYYLDVISPPNGTQLRGEGR